MINYCMDKHEKFMFTALELAEKGRGFVEPNPMVGALIVKNGEIIGRGYHETFGKNHAEINAINDAGMECKGSDIYVTLEPCTHFGKTPPCSQAIKEAGIKNVFIASKDPNPVAKTNGSQILKEAGINVIHGILENAADKLNAPFFKLISEKMPYVTAKWVMTLDGKIATRTGDSQWISNEESRSYVHKIRGEMDAIMVGIGTALADNPLLTCRTQSKRIAKRIIVDSNASLPLDSKLIKTIGEAEVLIATTEQAPEERVARLEDAGCKIIKTNLKNGKVDLKQVFEELGRMNLTNLLVEGGGKVFGSLLDNNLMDKAVIFVSPKIVGDANAISPVAGNGILSISQSIQFSDISYSQLANDIVIEAIVKK